MKHWNWKRTLPWLPYVVFGVLIILCYAIVLNAPFLIDDKAGIAKNPAVGKLSSVYKYPVSALRYFILYISYTFGGLNPAAYRVMNILFHFGTVSALYLVVKRLVNQRVALLSAVLFAVHPIATESVTWISAVTYPQYAFFSLLTIYAYVRGKEHRAWTRWSYLFFALALLSSEKAVAVPAILGLIEITYFSFKKNWKQLIPYAVIGGLMALLALSTLSARVQSFQNDYYIRPQYYNPIEHVPYSLTFYSQLVLFPDKLSIYQSELSITIWEFLTRWAAFIVLIVVMISSYAKKKHLFFWLGFFILATAPSLIPLNIVWVVAERYAYLGAAGLIVALSYLLTLALDRKATQTALYTLVFFLVIVLSGRTIVRNMDWTSATNLWTATVQTSPHSSNAHNNLGDVFAQRKDYTNAALEFQRAIELQPGDADPRHNLGIVLTLLGRYDEAIEAYRGALAINPNMVNANQNLGVIYSTKNKQKEALYYLQRAVDLGVRNPSVLKLLEITKQKAQMQ